MREKKIFYRSIRLSESQHRAIEQRIKENPELTISAIIRRAIDRFILPPQPQVQQRN